jgi:hypothetical protein
VPTSADRGCYVVSVTNPYGRILGFLDRWQCDVAINKVIQIFFVMYLKKLGLSEWLYVPKLRSYAETLTTVQQDTCATCRLGKEDIS